MKKAISVKQLISYIKTVFTNEPFFQRIYVEGEISNYKKNYRYSFFDLVEGDNLISCVQWEDDNIEYKNGDRVYVTGALRIFANASKYQISVQKIEKQGLGDKLLELKRLKGKLEKEGLFDQARKKTLPLFPRSIVLMTSFKGAVVHDFIKVMKRRYPLAKLYLYDILVQGSGAEESVSKAILEMDGKCDLMVLARGGGSAEDLSVFNSEMIARAIHSCQTPFMTAIGHQVDYSIADLCADYRAATPSEAAELAFPNLGDIVLRLDDINQNNYSCIQKKLDFYKDILDKNKSVKKLEKLYKLDSDLELKYKKIYFSLTKKLISIKKEIDIKQEKLDLKLKPNIRLFSMDGKTILSPRKIDLGNKYIMSFNDDEFEIGVEKKND